MRIALAVTRFTERNLRLAAQIGVTDIVGRYTGPRLEELIALRDRVERFGMKLSVIEGYIPHGDLVRGGPAREQQLALFQQLIGNMGQAGVSICCYNFMPGEDWTRTSLTTPHRGGALVTAFDASQVAPVSREHTLTADQLWDHLAWMLERLVPVAEQCGVKLAMHPDDPPLPGFAGNEQIMGSVESFERLVDLVPSPANGICFCQGCFSEMGLDVPATIRRLGKHIHFVHFRDVCGCATDFHETFHDNGQTNMFEAMRAYREIGFEGPMRPDHAPTLEGEQPDADLSVPTIPADQVNADTFNGSDVPVQPGYTMLGRLYAVGYMRGLIEAVANGDRGTAKNDAL